jgi:hypothetical protein
MGRTQEVVRARPSFHVSVHQQLPDTGGPTLWGTDSWLCSEWFPKVVNDLVGRMDTNFRPRTHKEKEGMYVREIQYFIQEASESPQGEFWRNVKEQQSHGHLMHMTCEEREKTLPYHRLYVYSSRFLASVCLLFYEVRSVTYRHVIISPNDDEEI